MDATARLIAYLAANANSVGKVVNFDGAKDKLYHFDLTAGNAELSADIFCDTNKFSQWVTEKLSDSHCKYGVGGYMEHRTIYARSPHFDAGNEPRRLHMGIDIWGEAGTCVYSPLKGKIHSFQDNNHFGDYGPTIILEHDLDGLTLYTLYGHLSRKSLAGLNQGMPVERDQQIATFGETTENGNWPPHLHFQLMFNMEGCKGDYPGVCRYSEKEQYTKNIPDPQLILKFPVAIND